MTARLWRWLRSHDPREVAGAGMGLSVAAVLLTVVFGAGECHGRRSVKPTVVTETKTVEVVKWRDRLVTQSNVAEQEQTRTREITRWLPGQVVEREVVKWRDRDVQRLDLAVRDVSEDRRSEAKTVTVTAPERNWAVTLQGGAKLDGRKVAALSLERRLFGGVSVVGTVTSDRAAMCGVTVRF